MFGIGGGRRQRQAAELANGMLAKEYAFWFGRLPPPNLATVIVQQSFNPRKLRDGGRVGPAVHAAEALKFGYADADLNPDQKAMCAVAYSSLLSTALASGNELQLPQLDRHCIAIMAQTTIGSLAHQSARAKLELYPETSERFALLTAQWGTEGSAA